MIKSSRANSFPVLVETLFYMPKSVNSSRTKALIRSLTPNLCCCQILLVLLFKLLWALYILELKRKENSSLLKAVFLGHFHNSSRLRTDLLVTLGSMNVCKCLSVLRILKFSVELPLERALTLRFRCRYWIRYPVWVTSFSVTRLLPL